MWLLQRTMSTFLKTSDTGKVFFSVLKHNCRSSWPKSCEAIAWAAFSFPVLKCTRTSFLQNFRIIILFQNFHQKLNNCKSWTRDFESSPALLTSTKMSRTKFTSYHLTRQVEVTFIEISVCKMSQRFMPMNSCSLANSRFEWKKEDLLWAAEHYDPVLGERKQ